MLSQSSIEFCWFIIKMAFVQNKVALVTGGASGIGFAVTRKLLENGVKAVAIVDFSEKNGEEAVSSLQKQHAKKVIFIKADVTKDLELRNAFEKTIETFKNLDIVINNAGIVNEIDWEKTVAVNLVAVMRGTYLAIQEYLPKYKSSSEGLILNTASILGIDTIPGATAYCTTKHGVVGLGKALRRDETCLKSGIRVMTLCPGVVQTPLLPSITADNPEAISRELAKLSKIQSSPDYIANSVLEMINNGEHGSVWVAEDEETPYEVDFPNRLELRKTS